MTPSAEPTQSSTRAVGASDKRRIGAAVALVVLGAAAAACGTTAGAATAQPDCSAGAPKITVDAGGQASATPDILTIDLGVTVNDPTASSALSDANMQATTLTGTLKSSGVTPADIKSTDFSINPTMTPTGAITGYQVSNTLLVTLHDLTSAGQVIDAAAASVGNAIRIEGLTFSVSNTGDVDGQARADAAGDRRRPCPRHDRRRGRDPRWNLLHQRLDHRFGAGLRRGRHDAECHVGARPCGAGRARHTAGHCPGDGRLRHCREVGPSRTAATWRSTSPPPPASSARSH